MVEGGRPFTAPRAPVDPRPEVVDASRRRTGPLLAAPACPSGPGPGVQASAACVRLPARPKDLLATLTLPTDTQPTALQLHGLLGQIDPARWRPEVEARVRHSLTELHAAMDRLVQSLDARGPFAAIRDALVDAMRLLADAVPAPGLGRRDARAAWKTFRCDLTHAYERLSKNLEAWDIHVPALRPTNYARNVLHVGSGTAAALTLWAFPSQSILVGIIGSVTVWAWSVETLRRRSPKLNAWMMWAFGPVAHPHETHRVNSATWYATALLVLALLDIHVASLVALLVLGYGDPMAAIIGRRFGRTKLVNGRSLEGTAAFVLAGGAVATVALTLAYPTLPWSTALLTAFAGAFVGSLAELFSRRIDDNFSIPLTAAAAATVVLHLLGYTA